MAEFKFSCPHCDQHIQCDQQWAGQTIPCPACSGQIAVPQIPVATLAPPRESSTAPAPSPAPVRKAAAKKPEPTFPLAKVLMWSGGVAVGVVALIFGLRYGLVAGEVRQKGGGHPGQQR